MNMLDKVAETLKSKQNDIKGQPLYKAKKEIQVFFKQILHCLNLPEWIVDKYSIFTSDETILYFNKTYRDHVFHSFHVFLLGFLLLRKLESVNKTDPENSPLPFEDTFLKKWLITSLYHDVTYVAERGPAVLRDLIDKRFKVKIDASQNWIPLMKNKDVIEAINMITAEFNSITTDRDKQHIFQGWLNEQLLARNDHGVFSAILLIMDYKENEKQDKNKDKLDDKTISECALAIALHNYRKIFYRDIKHTSNALGTLNIKDYQLAYLLSYCDTAQEWGRLPKKSYEASYIKMDIDQTNRKITTYLEYDVKDLNSITDPDKRDSEINKRATQEQLTVNELRDSWNSIGWMFRISHSYFPFEQTRANEACIKNS